MKNNWLSRNLFLICAGIWYILMVFSFLNGETTAALRWFMLGDLYVIIHLVNAGRQRRAKMKEGTE